MLVQRFTVQPPVTLIIKEIIKRRPARDALDVSSNVEFQNRVLPGKKNMRKSAATHIKANESENNTDNGTDNEADSQSGNDMDIDNEIDNQTDNDTDNKIDNEADNEEENKNLNEAVMADIAQTQRYMT